MIRIIIVLLLSGTQVALAQTLNLQILDQAGIGLENAWVRSSQTEGKYTDAEGSVVLSRLQLGDTVRVGKFGFFDQVRVVDQFDRTLIITLQPKTFDLNEVELIAGWINGDEPFTYSSLEEEDIRQRNMGVDVPFLMQWLPGAVVTSDAGTGIGYTGYRIRGSDPSRINVTIDGVPLNDSESQGVFWVDLPDFASSVKSIQVQRGVGTSTNGAGAFGGTIGLQTNDASVQPLAKIDVSGGAFKTRRGAVSLGTGRMKNGLSLEGRGSLIRSEGYIDRASANLNSLMLSASYLSGKHSLRFNAFTGHEITYQAWNGVPAQYIEDAVLRKSNTAGQRADGSFHPDEVDNYRQTHYHLHWNNQVTQRHLLKISLHYTKGKGYFEQYRIEDDLGDYGLSPISLGETSITSSDLIRRRWLDNDFGGLIFALRDEGAGKPYDWQLGGGFNHYLGDHFGEVIWARSASDSELGSEYYRNDAVKNDGNIYGQLSYRLGSQLTLFGDLQWRNVYYRFDGFDQNLSLSEQEERLNFFNPKAGIRGKISRGSWYYSMGVAHREPNRDDYVSSSPRSRPQVEKLTDHELGIEVNWEKLGLKANAFYMNYRDQLVLTGVINDVGEYVRQNVPRSFRTGIELEATASLSSRFRLVGNAVFSSNQIKNYIEFVDDWDTWQQIEIERGDTEISFSPSQVWYLGIFGNLWASASSTLQVILHTKYIGAQYLDNTSADASRLPAYWYSDLECYLTLANTKEKQQLGIKLQIRNLFNEAIISNGWLYRYKSAGYDGRPDDPHTRIENDSFYNLTGYYPQALRNVMFGLTYTF